MPQSIDAFELIIMCGGLDLTPVFDAQAEILKRRTRFHSHAPPVQTLSRIAAVLQAQGVQHRVHQARFKIRITHATNDGHRLTCTVQVFLIAPGLHLVDWRRGHGDLLAYHAFYTEQRARLSDLVSTPPG